MITYKITLDVRKHGIQGRLSGMRLGESNVRKLIVTLAQGKDPIVFTGIEEAFMFVTKPSDETPSIEACTIVGNQIEYILSQDDVSEVGTTNLQLKIQGRENNAPAILYAPTFEMEVTDPECDDSHIPSLPTYSVLEALIDRAEITTNLSEAYALGTVEGLPVPKDHPAYHNNSKYWAENTGEFGREAQEAMLDSEAYAKGTRGGEAVLPGDKAYHNNAKYYSDEAKGTLAKVAEAEANANISKTLAEGYAADAETSKNDAETAKSDAESARDSAIATKTATEGIKTATDGIYHNALLVQTQITTDKDIVSKAVTDSSKAAQDAYNYSQASAISAEEAEMHITSAEEKALISEGYAKGTQHGEVVGPDSPYYHNNSEYFKEQAKEIVGAEYVTKEEFGALKVELETMITVEGETLVINNEQVSEYVFDGGGAYGK